MKLIIRQRGETTEYTPDPNLGIIKVGRADTNDVTIKGEKAASREHLTLERTVDGWKLVDQMSSNGTALNGEKVNFGFVKEGDLIQVGQTTIQITGLEPAPGASPAPARQARRAAARAVPPKAARADASSEDAEGRNAPPIPKKKSPVGGLIALGVIVLVVGIGGYVLFDQISGSSTPTQNQDDQVADRDDPRQAELSDDEKAALTLAEGIVSGDDSTLEKLNRLEKIQDGLKSTRGSKAASDISVMKSKLMKQLDDEVSDRVDTELETVNTAILSGMYAEGIERIDELVAYLDSDAYIANLANPYRKDIQETRETALKQNETFIDTSYEQMRNYTAQLRYDEALEVCDEMLAKAWMDAATRDLYETERSKIETLKKANEVKEPVVEEDDPVDGSGILGKVKKSEGKLPGKNPLLPNGKRSEQELVEALHGKMIEAAEDKKLTDDIFTYKGKTAKISGADEKKLVLEVVHIDKRTEEELIYNTSVKWEEMNAEDVLQLYDRTPDLSGEDKLALVVFCYDNGFTNQAAERAWQLYSERNEWKEGIDILIATKRKIKIPDGGFVEFEGALVTPDEKESGIFYRKLAGVLERFEKGIGHRDRSKREDSEKAFQELLDMGERAIKPSIEILQGVLDKEMENAKKATGLLAADERMDELLTELEKRREFALELIMDAEKYPYPYGPNQAEVQAEVDERVAAVREIWNDPAKFMGQTNPEFDAIMNKIREIANRMAQIDPSQDYYKETPDETVKYIENIANDKLTIREYTGDDSAKQKLYNYNVEVMQYNEDFPTGDGHTDSNGRLQVKITNEYRIMFGRVALKLNDKLFWAAYHHSKYCVENNGGQIAHEIPGEPRGEGPGDRMRYEGYPGGGGENIHMNGAGPTAQSSHDAWCHSSGHHRNILNPGWRVLGSGKFKTIWTQCFGGIDEKDQNSVSKGGE